MRPTHTNQDKHDAVAADVAAFLAKGGEIEQVDHTANRTFQDRNKTAMSRDEYHAMANENSFKQRTMDDWRKSGIAQNNK